MQPDLYKVKTVMDKHLETYISSGKADKSMLSHSPKPSFLKQLLVIEKYIINRLLISTLITVSILLAGNAQASHLDSITEKNLIEVCKVNHQELVA
jgi:hypothetical protein